MTTPPMREPTVMLHDLTGGLLWPRLLRLPALALRPERLVTALAAVVVIMLIGEISQLWNKNLSFNEVIAGNIVHPMQRLGEGAVQLNGTLVGIAARDLMHAPLDLLIADPWALFFLGIPMLLVWGVAGAAIGRSAACEVALGRVISWPEGLAFGMSKAVNCLGAAASPIIFVAFAYLLIAFGGFALMTWPGGNIVGAVLYGLALLLALLTVLIGVGYLLGWSMLVPAIACEGTDALDSIQRVYAYVVSRPVRLLVYLLIVLAVGAFSYGVFAFVVERTIEMCSSAGREWSGTRGTLAFATEPAVTGTNAAARSIIEFWHSVLRLVIGAYAVSFVHTAGTMVYLLCRRINDGQEIAELWTPDAR